MAPKPASTAGKAPASTASKAPAKSAEGTKAAKKTAKAAAPVEGEKKKRKKMRKETYSSYIYKGMRQVWSHMQRVVDAPQYLNRFIPTRVFRTKQWLFLIALSTTSSSGLQLRHLVSLLHYD